MRKGNIIHSYSLTLTSGNCWTFLLAKIIPASNKFYSSKKKQLSLKAQNNFTK